MNHLLAKLVTSFVFPKEKRKQIRRVLYSLDAKFFLKSPLSFKNILANKTNKADLLLVELNPFHIECLYSAYEYLKGRYSRIVVLSTPENISLKMFPDGIQCLETYPWVVRFLDKFGYFNRIKTIFCGSYFVWKQNKTIEHYFSSYLAAGKNLLTIDHAPGKWSPVHSDNLNVRQFVLADFLSQVYSLPALYTCLFPADETKLNGKHKFLSVGVVGDQSRRDMDAYIDWLNKDPDNSSYIICSSIDDPYREKLEKVNVNLYVRASFSQLFQCCREAVFLPFLIHNGDLGYYEQAISGNLNLALGFSLIPIIDKRLADLYGFSEEHAVIYRGKDEFLLAMQTAQNMTADEIRRKQNALKKLKAKLIAESSDRITQTL